MQIKLNKILFKTGTGADYEKLTPLANDSYDQGFEVIQFETAKHNDGDRIEAIACSLVFCATNYILSVHVEVVELSGTIDEILL